MISPWHSKTDGTLWGFGIADCLGLGNNGDVINPYVTDIDINGAPVNHYLQTHPVQIMTGVRAICASDTHAFAITTDGTLWGWGKNSDFSLGAGDDEAQFIIMLTLNKHAAGDQHMRIFSRLARRIMHEEFRNALVNAASADAIASLLQHELEL